VGETRTTIVLPTPIFKHLKMQALLENKTLKGMTTEIICDALRNIEKVKLGEDNERAKTTHNAKA
jgi:hypothetical protein